MSNNWSNFINEILLNIDNDKPRSIRPIKNSDKKEIITLNETDALILWKLFFPETAKYALLFERTYGEPIELPIFEENEVSLDERKQILGSMHKAETPILIYWNHRIALKTNWGMLIKYWDNFFYYPEDAIIFVDQNHIYFYNEMILKKLTKLELKNASDESVFDCLQQLEDSVVKKCKQIDCLFECVPNNLQDNLYRLFHIISEGFKVIEDETILNEYMEYCLANWWSSTEKVVLASKPYNKESLQNFIKEIEGRKKVPDTSLGHFYEILKKIADKQ